MPNSKKPSDFDDENLSFEERIHRHKSRLADAAAYSHTYKTIINEELSFDDDVFMESKADELPQKQDESTLTIKDFDGGVEIDFGDDVVSNAHKEAKVTPNHALKNNDVGLVSAKKVPPATNSNASTTLNEATNRPVAPKGNESLQDDKSLKDDTPLKNNALSKDNQVDSTQKHNKPAHIKINPKGRGAIAESLPEKIELSKKTLNSRQVGTIMAVSLLLITWLKQDRLADYWQQTYQSGEPWTTLVSVGAWQSGEKVGHFLGIDGVNAGLASVGQKGQDVLNNAFFAEKLAQERAKKEAEQREMARLVTNQGTNANSNVNASTQTATQNAQNPNNASANTNVSTTPPTAQKSDKPLEYITLHAGQKVLFAGDSMMQGVAPWVMRKLKSDYHIDSMDLSKQSTGLSYSSFFDWPATIKKAFADHSEIGALVIYLGANDPWAVPNPANKAAKYIDFATDEWTVLYHEKMRRILDNAKSHGVQVIWITPPTMKKPKLNEQMKVLTEIMHRGIDKTQVVVMDSKPLMSPSDDYTDTIVIGDKTTKVRTADGIHFTTDGQKHLANHILARIKTEP